MLVSPLLFLPLIGCANVPVFVIAFNRPEALQTCLGSVKQAFSYCNWTGELTVLIDGPRSSNEETARVADSFCWPHGSKSIIRQESNIGLFGQRRLASASDSEYWLVLEDDAEVSHASCLHLQPAIKAAGEAEDVVGVSLTLPQWQLGVNEHGKWRRLDKARDLSAIFLLFPAVSTWAQIFFRDAWELWRAYEKEAQRSAAIRGSIYERWHQLSPATVWSRDFQAFMNIAGLQNLYLSFPNRQSLAITHRRKGLNTPQDKGPNGVLLRDDVPGHCPQDGRLLEYTYCFDRIDEVGPVYANYIGLSYELTQNHICFLRAQRLPNIVAIEDERQLGAISARSLPIMSGLDYFGDERLWTAKMLQKQNKYLLGCRLECCLMECKYKEGLYPHYHG